MGCIVAKIKRNSHVLFYYNRSKKWLTRVSTREELHTHIGVIRHRDAIGKEYGSRLVTNKDKYVYLLEPTMHDYVMKLQHGTQIVYPKELGYIAVRAGIQSGQTVVEIGTGSGSLTSYVAGIVGPRGHVYTFDVDEGFMRIAAKNIERAGMTKRVTQKRLDLKTSRTIPVKEADVALIDLGDPWEVVPKVRQMLKGSGTVFAVCPTMNQLEKLTTALVGAEFTDIESTELLLRNIEAREGKTRHSFQGIGHTTYLCHARKAFFDRGSDGPRRGAVGGTKKAGGKSSGAAAAAGATTPVGTKKGGGRKRGAAGAGDVGKGDKPIPR